MMALFDALTGRASNKAAKLNIGLINQGLATGSDALTQGANSAIDSLGTRGQGSALQALDQGYATARNDVTAGYDRAAQPLAQLGAAYNPMVQQGGKAYSAYNDAIGANGTAGNARATAAFQAGPGYEFQRDQALEAIQRSAAARGGLAGGNATRDLLATATGLADQSYQNYINNLKGGSDFYTQGLAGQAQGLGAQANAAIGQGSALSALGTGLGTNRANLYTNAASIQNGLGGRIADLNTNAMNALVANNNNRAQAQNQASGNLLKLGQDVFSGLAGFFK